jgi:hypothetical protein
LYFTSAPVITNTIVSNNSGGSGGIFAYQSSPSINYSDVWNNSPANYSGCSAGTGCISADPVFVNAGSGDYHLQTSSPCIDTGDNYAPDIPAYDFDGYPRIIDGNDDGSAVVDLGPFEHPEIVGLQEDIRISPITFTVENIHPNPFSAQVVIRFNVIVEGRIEIALHNVLGEEIVDLCTETKSTGMHSIAWDGKNRSGAHVSDGIYYVVFTNRLQKEIRKVVVLR